MAERHPPRLVARRRQVRSRGATSLPRVDVPRLPGWVRVATRPDRLDPDPGVIRGGGKVVADTPGGHGHGHGCGRGPGALRGEVPAGPGWVHSPAGVGRPRSRAFHSRWVGNLSAHTHRWDHNLQGHNLQGYCWVRGRGSRRRDLSIPGDSCGWDDPVAAEFLPDSSRNRSRAPSRAGGCSRNRRRLSVPDPRSTDNQAGGWHRPDFSPLHGRWSRRDPTESSPRSGGTGRGGDRSGPRYRSWGRILRSDRDHNRSRDQSCGADRERAEGWGRSGHEARTSRRCPAFHEAVGPSRVVVGMAMVTDKADRLRDTAPAPVPVPAPRKRAGDLPERQAGATGPGPVR